MSALGWIAFGVLAYVLCGYVSYLMQVAYFQRKFPAIAAETLQDDRRLAARCAIFGPINLAVAIGFDLGWIKSGKAGQ